jgi:Na+/H+ antiporter NhaD/arsenite permease-like protein
VWTALVVFVLTYLIILGQKLPLLRLDRPSGAATGAVLMVVLGVVTPMEAYREAVDHATLVLLLGMMIVTGYLAESGFFRWASYATLRAAGTARRLLVGITLLCAVLSAFVVNDTVCLMVTPLVLQVVHDAKLPPLPFLFAVAFGANAGSTATPTGNPQNMIVATLSGMPYAEFTAALAPAAAAATLVVLAVLLWCFRRDLPPGPLPELHVAPPPIDRPLLVKSLVALGGVVVAFLAGADLAWTAMAGAAFLILVGARPPRKVLLGVDWLLLLFFAGLFVVVYGVGKTGLADRMFEALAPLTSGGPVREAVGLATITVIGSNLFSNVPFVMLGSHFVGGFTDPTLAWQILALASTLAGNLTLVGSVANVIVFELAGARGRVSFAGFLKVGVPVTLLSTAAGLAVLLALR